MTTILGIRQNGVTYLAADTRVCGPNPLPVRQCKTKEAGPWAIAHSGEIRLLNLLDERRGDLAACADPLALVRVIRRAIEEDGWQKEPGKGSAVWAVMTLLVGSASGLWQAGCDFSVSLVDEGRIIGAGSGHEYALGAWAALERASLSTPDALREAIRIAASFDPGTGGPVDVVVLGEPSEDPANMSPEGRFFYEAAAESPADTSTFTGRHRLRIAPSGLWPDYPVDFFYPRRAAR